MASITSLARFRDRRKVFHPFVRTRRVDDRARVEAFLSHLNDGIEGPAPAAAKDIDIFSRFAAGAHGPNNIVGVRRIDIVIDDDYETAEIGAGMALRCDHRGLFGMARDIFA